MTKLRWDLLSAFAVAVFFSAAPNAQALNLPRIFSDSMVLQRDLPIKVWGWAEAGQEVEVSFAGQTKTAKADAAGKWMVSLEPQAASAEPRELSVAAGDKRVTIKDVLVGEVWICSGQSNMEFTVGGTHNAKEVIDSANYPLLRQFRVPQVISVKPQPDLPGDWTVCSPRTAANFTGVGYHFGLQLLKKLNVPVALINTSWGGTRIEPWTDPAGFGLSPKLKEISELVANADRIYRRNVNARLDPIESWVKQSREAIENKAAIPAFPGPMPEHPLNRPDRPTAIYNAMIAPLIPYGIRGAIWYQGESNNGEGMLYFEKMKALIGSWRQLWEQGEFPFLYVQLAPFKYNNPEALPGIWEAQRAALTIPNTGMAVITDIGNVADIHPRNKEEVGRRLSLWALAKTYNQSGFEYCGPLYKAMKVEGNKAILTFEHGDGLKSLDGKPLSWFTVAGEDRKFTEAKAEIAGDTVVVSSDAVAKPVAARFGWNEIAEPNLANGAGLPASPFRTDAKTVKVMVIGGQNNHDWSKSTPFMRDVLDKAGHFEVVVNNAPAQGAPRASWDAWRPKFHEFDCVVLDYNGEMWPEPVKKDFVDYVAAGGGAIVIHAANNAFNGWKEFEQMVGLLWRDKSFGYSLYLDDQGQLVRESPGEGRGMGHGGQYDWVMTTRDREHPITAGMPLHWLHRHDELYHGQRGPAENIHLLLTAYSDPAPGRGGTGKNEPIVWWVPYGKGKVVVNVMGHVGELGCMQCVGFQTLLTRACEWAATGQCVTPIGGDFPTEDKVSLRQ